VVVDTAFVRGGWGSRFGNPVDWYWDARLGVRTFGYHPGIGDQNSTRWHVVYAPAVYADIFDGLRAAGIGADDVFADLGSGLGRAVFAAAHLGVARAIGVEYEAALHAAALANRATCKHARDAIEFHDADARNFDLSGVNLLFLFHPFGASILQAVIDNLRATPRARRLRIVYHNPVCESVLEASGWLTLQQRLPVRANRLGNAGRFETAIWAEAT
jgi:SAM-dependent methyltransferase